MDHLLVTEDRRPVAYISLDALYMASATSGSNAFALLGLRS